MVKLKPVYFIAERKGEGLYSICTDGDPALWSLRRLRKDTRCAATGQPLCQGEFHYAPIGNMGYRARRLSRAYVEKEETAVIRGAKVITR